MFVGVNLTTDQCAAMPDGALLQLRAASVAHADWSSCHRFFGDRDSLMLPTALGLAGRGSATAVAGYNCFPLSTAEAVLHPGHDLWLVRP